jgi:hypothetical protein
MFKNYNKSILNGLTLLSGFFSIIKLDTSTKEIFMVIRVMTI